MLDLPEVVEVYHVAGEEDLLVRVAVRDAAHLRDAVVGADSVRERLATDGLAMVVGEAEGERRAGLLPTDLEELRASAQPDIMVVQAQSSSGHLVRTDPSMPVWPESLGLAVLVAQVGAAGRLWTAATGQPDESDPPRRVEVSDLVESLQPLLAQLPEGTRLGYKTWIPFNTVLLYADSALPDAAQRLAEGAAKVTEPLP